MLKLPSGLDFLNRFIAMGYPICPNPTNPNRIADVVLDHLFAAAQGLRIRRIMMVNWSWFDPPSPAIIYLHVKDGVWGKYVNPRDLAFCVNVWKIFADPFLHGRWIAAEL